MPHPDDHRWMGEALELARAGIGLCSPNPCVGAVVVRDGEAVGRGWHTWEQRDHAEVAALREAGARARGATLYVTLEPCCHKGRTPPCTAAIEAAGIARVAAAVVDPNPRVAGGGAAALRSAGIAVETGCRRAEAERLLWGFARWIRSGLPLVTVKAALSLDGWVAAAPGVRTQLTGEEAQREVQALRHASDAVLTGVGTVICDDPQLSDRSGRPRRRPLLRVVADPNQRMPANAALAGAEDVWVARTRDLGAVLQELGRREMLEVLVEAGPGLNTSLLAEGRVDRLLLYYAPVTLGAGGVPFVHQPLQWSGSLEVRRAGRDAVVEMLLRDPFA